MGIAVSAGHRPSGHSDSSGCALRKTQFARDSPLTSNRVHYCEEALNRGALGLQADTSWVACFAPLQRELRHPPRKLRIHTADTILLNREIIACEGDCLDQV